MEAAKLRWRWDSELVNDRESESFGLFRGGGGINSTLTGTSSAVREGKMRGTVEKRVKKMKGMQEWGTQLSSSPL